MSMKSRIQMLAMMSLLSAANGMYGSKIVDNELTEEEIELLKKKFEDKQEQLKINQGLSKFWYGSNYVWARNQKNADRKAKNNGYL